MKFQCPQCAVSFAVPDDKIPEGRGIKLLCPKCRAPIALEDGGANGASMAEPMGAAGSEAASVFDDAALLDVFEEGVKTALLCVSNSSRLEQFRVLLQQLDMFVVPVPRHDLALAKLHHNAYDLVLLEESYGGGNISVNPVLRHIQLLPMHIRRRFFLCLLSETAQTLDELLAFRLGVDMIFNAKDLDKAKIILSRKMREHQSFYKIFSDESARKGQL